MWTNFTNFSIASIVDFEEVNGYCKRDFLKIWWMLLSFFKNIKFGCVAYNCGKSSNNTRITLEKASFFLIFQKMSATEKKMNRSC